MPSPIIKLAVDVHNRHNKRGFLEEAKRILPQLEEINASFIEALFDDNDKRSYMAIYHHFKQQWDYQVEWFLRNVKPKHLILNVYLFEELYKPRNL